MLRAETQTKLLVHGVDVEVVEFGAAPNSPITRKPLSKLGASFDETMIIGGVFRDGGWKIAVGDTQIHDDERVIVICTSRQLKNVRKLFLV